jgi:hypothetical protein
MFVGIAVLIIFCCFETYFGVFFLLAPCSVADIDRRFRWAYCFHHQNDESQKTAIFINQSVFFFDLSVRRMNSELLASLVAYIRNKININTNI